MKKTLVLAVSSLLLFGVGTTAASASSMKYVVKSITVNYEDLNIQSNAGARTLYARLKQASENVCGVGSIQQLGSISRVSNAKNCYQEALSEAVDNIDSEALSKLHSS